MPLIHDKLTRFWCEVFPKKDRTHGFGPSLWDFTDQIYMNELWFIKHILGLKIFFKGHDHLQIFLPYIMASLVLYVGGDVEFT